jgi:hypothetical protein
MVITLKKIPKAKFFKKHAQFSKNKLKLESKSYSPEKLKK